MVVGQQASAQSNGIRRPALPNDNHPVGSILHAKLDPLVEIGRAAGSQNTNRAYTADWREYLRWRPDQGPKCVGLYLAAMASGRRERTDRRRHRAAVSHR